MKHYLLAILAIFIFTTVKSQDKIHSRKGKVINAKVIEIGTDEIKYTVDGKNLPVYVLENSKIESVEFADGTVKKFYSDFKDPESYEGQRTKAIKFNFLSPLQGYSQFSFEKSVSPLQSYELGFGIIGAGKNLENDNYYFNGQYRQARRDAFGGFVTAGYKFNKLPDYIRKGTRLSHLMQGTYVQPMIVLGYYKDNEISEKNNVTVMEKRSTLFGSLLLNLGHQWVFGEKFLVDIYGGLGYAFDDRSDDRNFYFWGRNHFVVQKSSPGTGLGMDGGIRIGLLIK